MVLLVDIDGNSNSKEEITEYHSFGVSEIKWVGHCKKVHGLIKSGYF